MLFSQSVDFDKLKLKFKFQSPKTGLCFSHTIVGASSLCLVISFNPLKRVYAFLTARLLIAKNKKQYYSFYFRFNNQISPLLIYRVFENKMFGDNLQYFTKKYPHFTCKNPPIVPPHPGDSLPGFSHFPKVSPKPQNNPWRQHPKFCLNQVKHNLFSYLPTPQQNHLLQTCLTNLIKPYTITPLNQGGVF